MATTLGSLVVRLGLDAAEFTTGLTASEREARRFAQRIDAVIKAAVNVTTIALASMTTAATAAFTAVDQLAKQAGEFQDLAEMTGASAEGLASFAVAAGVAGTGMETIAAASVKLTANMTEVNDESKAAGAALTALGIPIKDFKALAPEAQIEEVARALASFEDGAGKTAVAVALFGKAGAQLLPFLKELAAEGGRQVILTQEQIELADAYADAQAKAATQLRLYAQAAATQAVPAINAVTNAAKEFIGEIIGIDNETKKLRDNDAVRQFAETTVLAFARVIDAGDGVIRIFQGTGLAIGAGLAAKGEAMRGNFEGARAVVREFQADLDKLINRQLFSAKVEQQIASNRRTDQLRAQEDRGFRPQGRPLNFAGAVARPQAGTDAASEAQRYLDNLQKQIDRTSELTAVEQARNEILGGLKGLTPEIERQILALAAQIDAYKELDKWLKESGKAFDDQVRQQRELNEAQAQATRSALDRGRAAQDNNDRLRDEIAIILGGERAQKALAKAYAESAVAEAEKDRMVRASLGASEAELKAIDATIEALREYRELLDGRDLAEQLARDAQALQDVKNMFSDTFADAFADFITGTKTAKEAFADFAGSILRQISRIAAQNIANAIFGGNNSAGPDIFGMFAKIGASFFGGGGYTGGFSGGGFGEHFAMGGVSSGGMALVGERGPELVDLPAGARVYNNSETRGMLGGQIVTLNFSVQGPVNRATEYQIAQAAQRGLARAGRR